MVYNTRAFVYIHRGQYDLAIADCNKAIELDPNLAVAYNNRAWAYGVKGQYDLAIADCNKAIELDLKMKKYQVWEANRKVFLYPENWIEPELRDEKSPFFDDLENELLLGFSSKYSW